tara:strand:- start:256 stop:702 length:447 start_codon:yes stop_codon:yes gene_type:complete
LLELAAKITDSAPSMAFVISAMDEVTEHCFVVTLPLASSLISEVRDGKLPFRVAATTSHPFSAAYFTHRFPVFPFAPITTIWPSPPFAKTAFAPLLLRVLEGDDDDDDDDDDIFFRPPKTPSSKRPTRAVAQKEELAEELAADAIIIV